MAVDPGISWSCLWAQDGYSTDNPGLKPWRLRRPNRKSKNQASHYTVTNGCADLLLHYRPLDQRNTNTTRRLKLVAMHGCHWKSLRKLLVFRISRFRPHSAKFSTIACKHIICICLISYFMFIHQQCTIIWTTSNSRSATRFSNFGEVRTPLRPPVVAPISNIITFHFMFIHEQRTIIWTTYNSINTMKTKNTQCNIYVYWVYA